ncbi:MAG TPA: hypothetical protein VD770_04235 [Coxiellaceae bacterium]|nr:hypothetical protein [Coxiellaceae bacterium]
MIADTGDVEVISSHNIRGIDREALNSFEVLVLYIIQMRFTLKPCVDGGYTIEFNGRLLGGTWDSTLLSGAQIAAGLGLTVASGGLLAFAGAGLIGSGASSLAHSIKNPEEGISGNYLKEAGICFVSSLATAGVGAGATSLIKNVGVLEAFIKRTKLLDKILSSVMVGAVGEAASLVSSLTIEACGEAGALVRVGVGAAVGGSASAVTQVVENFCTDKDLTEGVLEAAVIGSVIEAITALPGNSVEEPVCDDQNGSTAANSSLPPGASVPETVDAALTEENNQASFRFLTAEDRERYRAERDLFNQALAEKGLTAVLAEFEGSAAEEATFQTVGFFSDGWKELRSGFKKAYKELCELEETIMEQWREAVEEAKEEIKKIFHRLKDKIKKDGIKILIDKGLKAFMKWFNKEVSELTHNILKIDFKINNLNPVDYKITGTATFRY